MGGQRPCIIITHAGLNSKPKIEKIVVKNDCVGETDHFVKFRDVGTT